MKMKLFEATLVPLEAYLGVESPYRGVIMAVGTLVLLLYAYRRTRKRLIAYLEAQAHKSENVANFLRAYDAAWKAAIAIVVIVAAGGSFKLLGLSVALLGTMLGWSLQVPIRGLAAWVMVVLKKPFRVGDRIAVAGVTGDVTDVQLNHIVLNQVGGSVQGEERSGRAILVPTAMLFAENVINYNFFGAKEEEEPQTASKYMLDEVLVRVTFGSDYELAKRVCLEAAAKAVAEIIGEVDEEPFTRAEFMAWGMLIRVRFKTVPAKRQEVSSRVTQLIWEAFTAHADKVHFCFPEGTWHVRRTAGEDLPCAKEPPRSDAT